MRETKLMMPQMVEWRGSHLWTEDPAELALSMVMTPSIHDGSLRCPGSTPIVDRITDVSAEMLGRSLSRNKTLTMLSLKGDEKHLPHHLMMTQATTSQM